MKKLKISDLLVIALIVLVLIPSTRKGLSTFMNRITLRNPSTTADAKLLSLEEDDYMWEFTDFEGRTYTLGELKGELIFLNFWATWCPPCRAELPSIQKLYNNYKDSVCFIFLSTEDQLKVFDYLNEKNFSIPVYQLTTRPPEKLFSSSIPATFIISPKGEILLQHFGSANWNSESIHNLINNNLIK